MKTIPKQKLRLYIAFTAIFLIGMPLLNVAGVIGDPTLNLWGRYFAFAIAALGVDLIWGYTGLLSLCQAFFFCLGGYAIGMHMLLMTGAEGKYGAAIPDFMVWNQVKELPAFWEPFHNPVVTLILALAIPAVFAAIFGFLVFRSRVKGVYFAIITQALALAAWLVFNRNEVMLGGTNGLTDFKRIFGFPLTGEDAAANAATKRGLYVVTVLVLMGCYAACGWITRSKLGKVLIAIRDSEQRLRFTGYSITSYKVFAFVIGAVLAAIGGVLYVPQTGIITPSRMDVVASIVMVVWVAVGGRGTMIGPIIGALLVNLCYSVFTSSVPNLWPFFLGALFISVVLFFPDGVVGLIQRIRGTSKEASPAHE
jgi:urea transport system permease protein